MFTGGKLLWFVLLQYLRTASCCEPLNLQKEFCQSEFALKMGILEGDAEPNSFRVSTYRGYIMEVFKGNISRLNTKDNKVVIYKESKCPLPHDKVYIVFGRASPNNELLVKDCSSWPWSRVSSTIQRGFAGKYEKGCECLDLYYDVEYGSCLRSFSYVMKLNSVIKTCAWKRTKAYTKCINYGTGYIV